jgi:hypothetical protein
MRASALEPHASNVRDVSVSDAASSVKIGTWGIVLLALFVWAFFLREFTSPQGPGSAAYSKILSEFTVADLVVLGVCAAFYMGLAVFRPKWQLDVPRGVKWGAALVGAGVAVSLLIALIQGRSDIFVSWRWLVYVVLLVPPFAYAVRRPEVAERVAVIMLWVGGIRALYLLVSFVLGGGVSIASLGSLPVWDGPTLEILVACFAIGYFRLLSGRRRWWDVVLMSACLAVVVLAFRRTYWAEIVIVLAIGALPFVPTKRKPWVVGLTVIVTVAILVSIVLPGSVARFLERIESSNPFGSSTSSYANTNAAHLEDVLDGMYMVSQDPILGQTISARLEVERPGSTRVETTVIHNAPLNTWVRLGLLGLAGYVVFAVSIVRTGLRSGGAQVMGATTAFAAFLASQFIVTAAFSPPFYLSFQVVVINAIAVAFILATAAPAETRRQMAGDPA